jgi:ABC-type transport system involved in multi-copper enzyme maturation permease subunit
MNNWILGAIATCRFELMRSFNAQRLAASFGLSLFPPVMLWLVILAASRSGGAANVLSYVTFTIIFLVALVCLLSLLLWATPNVHGELEGKTWSFIAMRPGGRISNFLGKYLTAVLVSFSISCLALTLCTLVADRFGTLGSGFEPWKKWGILCGIFAIASLVYGAILSAIGTIFIKRAMVVGAGFLVGVETILAAVPAVVSRFTMSYHLRRLGELWLGWFLPDSQFEYEMIFGKAGPVWFHLLCVFSAMVVALVIGMVVVSSRQYATVEET